MDAQSLTEPFNLAAIDERQRLEALIKRAAAKDAMKDYNAAAELYSEATEIQAKLNGELSLENANLLFAYGKALYNVAVSKSDVLGSKVAGKAQPQPAPEDKIASSKSLPVADNLIKNAVASSSSVAKLEERSSEDNQSKRFFQFTGDENFDTDSEEENEDNAAEGDEDDNDDDDDFANAFEILDLARVLYHKKLSALEESGKGKSTVPVPELREIKEHLADTYDLQAEILLEGEKFSDAVTDLKMALELRQSLFPMEDPSVAECHYKLSLALEFGAVQHGDNSEGETKPAKVDEEMRKEAVTQMEMAIESCRVRMSQEQEKLETDGSLDEDKRAALKRKIANVKEIISDMEQRLLDLRRPPVSVEKVLDNQGENTIKGILGQIMGESESNKQSLLDVATQNATDLTAFVKRKPASSKSCQQASSAPKRPVQEEAPEGDSKRPRVAGGDEKAT
ncbi:SHNi-TPR domain-containing protein [Aspergillus foveolatus]|uniref:SHNi-TPR domain-containing protein n=1 Tax=Aspergillus foveolatus TaxID=210207 RepID=UPI003CCD8982